jgi:abortive infection bacteriophage resistance protein
VKYEKPAKTLEGQAELLISRGLVADMDRLVTVLGQINYYRLSTYLYTYRDGSERLMPGTKLDHILRIYEFDHTLRMLLLDVIEGVEILVRSRLAYHFAMKHGPFDWARPELFPGFNPVYNDFVRWQEKLQEQTRRSREQRANEDTVVHFFHKYGDEHERLPIWMLTEIMDFGATLSFYRGVEPSIRKDVAMSLDQPEELVMSWLLSLNTVRNRCAHHARLWNWQLGIPVKFPTPRKYPEWSGLGLSNKYIGAILYISSWISGRLFTKDQWQMKARDTLLGFSDLDLSRIGMPKGWENDEIWKPKGAPRAY